MQVTPYLPIYIALANAGVAVILGLVWNIWAAPYTQRRNAYFSLRLSTARDLWGDCSRLYKNFLRGSSEDVYFATLLLTGFHGDNDDLVEALNDARKRFEELDALQDDCWNLLDEVEQSVELVDRDFAAAVNDFANYADEYRSWVWGAISATLEGITKKKDYDEVVSRLHGGYDNMEKRYEEVKLIYLHGLRSTTYIPPVNLYPLQNVVDKWRRKLRDFRKRHFPTETERREYEKLIADGEKFLAQMKEELKTYSKPAKEVTSADLPTAQPKQEEAAKETD